MDSDRFEDFSNFNGEKRKQLIISYHKSFSFLDDNSNKDPTEQFDEHLLLLKRSKLVELTSEDRLIDTAIQYSLFYLEEYNYDLKSKGLSIVEHLLAEATCSQLLYNLRSKLIYTCLERYINDKDNLKFMDKTQRVMSSLLNVMESNQSSKTHAFKQHSVVFGALLNNSYMTTKLPAKLVYYNNFLVYIRQIGTYSCRHLEKILTVAFDCVDSSQITLNFEDQEKLLLKSLELIECTIEVCSLRIHVHAKRLVNFLIRLLYLISYSIQQESTDINSDLVNRIVALVKLLFKNKMAKAICYQEFIQLKKNRDLNPNFLRLIESI